MWIIPSNLPQLSAFVPEYLESKEDLKELESIAVSWPTWKSKPSSLPTWLRAWKRAYWVPHLFGRTLKPSMHALFVEKYTASLEVIHVPENRLPGYGKAIYTKDSFGQLLEKRFQQQDLFSAFSKTWTTTLRERIRLYNAAYETWVIQLRQEYSRRKKLALHMRENGCSSSLWRTPMSQYFGMITVETDVVRENNQTYRLGWTEKCKDGTKMGVGSPEYLLLFFKPQTDLSKGYADVPVVHNKESVAICGSCNKPSSFLLWEEILSEEEDIDLEATGGWQYKCPNCGTVSLQEDIISDFGYSRGNWQIDARAKWNSSGDSLLTPEEISRLDLEVLNKKFKSFFSNHIYDYEIHKATANEMDRLGRLPKKFETLKVPARTDAVWDDVVRMRTLNSNQSQRNQEQHICPFQLDIVKRCIELWSNLGDEIADSFGGIGSVGYEAIPMGRDAFLCELNSDYFKYGVRYCREAEHKRNIPTLFDVTEFEKEIA